MTVTSLSLPCWVTLLLLSSSSLSAQAVESIHACAQKSTGGLRVVSSADDCHEAEISVSWTDAAGLQEQIEALSAREAVLENEVDVLNGEIETLEADILVLQNNRCIPVLETTIVEGETAIANDAADLTALAPFCPLPSVRVGVDCNLTVFPSGVVCDGSGFCQVIEDDIRLLGRFSAVADSATGECRVVVSTHRAEITVLDAVSVDLILFGYDSGPARNLQVTASAVCAAVSCM